MDWQAISAIGTCLAAFVGIAGILLNRWDKTKRLITRFEIVPNFKIYISNTSLRTTVITKMSCSVGTHVFQTKCFENLQEISLPPATTQNIKLNKQIILNDYYRTGMSAICNPNDKIIITLYDNFGRKYIIKTDLTINAFRED